MRFRAGCLLVAAVGLSLAGVAMRADGTEQLGAPGISIATGTGIVAKGTGMVTQPGSIELEVPPGAIVKQVLVYWEGFNAENTGGDNTIVINGNSVTGALIGGPTNFFSGAWASSFRADITGLNLVTDGVSNLSLSGLTFTAANNGAGVIVIFDDGSTAAPIEIRDGSDLAFVNFAPPLDTTVAQTFTFPVSKQARRANLNLFFASVAGSVSGFGKRPTAIKVMTNEPGGGTTTWFDNELDSIDGEEWDTLPIFVNVPPGATHLSVQALSFDRLGTGGLPASFDWIASAFALEPALGLDGRMTGGGSVFTIDDVRVTRGFEIHCDLRNPNNLEINWPGNRFHLTALTGALCTDDPVIDQHPPNAPFDTFEGEGIGKLNNRAGARIEFVFVDAGEPGTSDTASLKIFDANNVLVLDVTGDPNVPGVLDKGNIQAHRDTWKK